MRTIELLLGGIIVVSTFVDIFQSVVVPRPTRGSLRLAPFLLHGMWPLWNSYPVLPYFRSVRPDESWVSALGALLDAATLIISCIKDGPAGPANLLYQGGCQLVNDLKGYFKISPAQAQTGIPRGSFEAAYTRLKSARAGSVLLIQNPPWPHSLNCDQHTQRHFTV
jgi:hypothetical protein